MIYKYNVVNDSKSFIDIKSYLNLTKICSQRLLSYEYNSSIRIKNIYIYIMNIKLNEILVG